MSVRASEIGLEVVLGPPQVYATRVSGLALEILAAAPLENSEGNVARTTELALEVAVLQTPPELSLSLAWTFSLDGHTFYVLNLGNVGTYVYDTVTQRWQNWSTQGYAPTWNFLFGQQWGIPPASRVVGADAASGYIWELDPSVTVDEAWRGIYHEVTAFIDARGRGAVRLDDLRVVGSVGYLDSSGPFSDSTPTAVFSMQYSDDMGTTWSEAWDVTLTEAHTHMEVAFRSLGSFKSPGRIFRFYDSGGLVRIDGADWNTNAAPPRPTSSPPQQQGGQS